MHCCSCNDHLVVPAGAVPHKEKYIVVQRFPFLCNDSQKTEDSSRPVCVKEFYEILNRFFRVHVKIKVHFTTKVTSDEILLKYNTSDGTYKEAPFLRTSEPQDSETPDVYFKIFGRKVIIYTKHFTIFIFAKKKGIKSFFNKSKTQRHIDLVTHAYFSNEVQEREVILRVYIRDINSTQHKKLKTNTEEREAKQNRCICVDDDKLNGLPDIINWTTTFQCIIYCQSKWKQFIIEVIIIIIIMFILIIITIIINTIIIIIIFIVIIIVVVVTVVNINIVVIRTIIFKKLIILYFLLFHLL